MSLRPSLRAAAAICVVAAVAAGGAYLARGDRYRLYTDAYAGRCWDALESLALSSSSLRPASVTVGPSSSGREVEVAIDYHMDRVLGGATLDAVCVFAEGEQRAQSIVLDGTPLDADTLSELEQ